MKEAPINDFLMLTHMLELYTT
ncbi:hypothetical protein U0070_004543 [Myodes glareolus]|uniref:Uncharacterized protein n=1 Tax=Myodes glareolus TaxID=447135 RepID=A0AAW0ICP3_MYOGA